MDDARLIASAVGRLIAAGIRQRGALAQRLGVTMTEVLALDYVVSAPGSAPGHLARTLLVSPSGATAVIDRLSRAGLITRVPASGRQRVALEATDVGRRVHAQVLAVSRGVERVVEDLARRDRLVLEQVLTLVADLAEREAEQLIAAAQADRRAASAMRSPVLWA